MSDDPAALDLFSEAEAAERADLVLANERDIRAAMAGRHPGLVIPACVGVAAELAVGSLPVEQVEAMVEELCRLLRDRARGRLELRRALLAPAAGNA
jgi:hypothetical protein